MSLYKTVVASQSSLSAASTLRRYDIMAARPGNQVHACIVSYCSRFVKGNRNNFREKCNEHCIKELAFTVFESIEPIFSANTICCAPRDRYRLIILPSLTLAFIRGSTRITRDFANNQITRIIKVRNDCTLRSRRDVDSHRGSGPSPFSFPAGITRSNSSSFRMSFTPQKSER